MTIPGSGIHKETEKKIRLKSSELGMFYEFNIVKEDTPALH